MWVQIRRAIADLWLSQTCVFCDRASPESLCASCWQQIQGSAAAQPPMLTAQALPVLTWGHYERQLKQAIAQLKYDGHPRLAESLGRALGERWQVTPIPTRQRPTVVPIPLHPEKLKARGFNQAALLAAAFCRQTGLPYCEHGLTRQRNTLPQFGLGADARQTNLSDAFGVGRSLQQRQSPGPILLLDDIYTTGATVRSAATTLRRQGFSVCGVVVLARAGLHSAPAKPPGLTSPKCVRPPRHRRLN